MARPRPTPDTPPPAGPSFGEKLAEALTTTRAERIRRARARKPTPTYQQIALEVGCCEKTVYNVLRAPGAVDAP